MGMDVKLGILFLLLGYFTVINCWVELDIAGNDMSRPNPQFVKPDDGCDDGQNDDHNGGGGGGGHHSLPKRGGGGRRRGGKGGRRGRGGKGGRRGRGGRGGRGRSMDDKQALNEVDNFANNMDNSVSSPDEAGGGDDQGGDDQGGDDKGGDDKGGDDKGGDDQGDDGDSPQQTEESPQGRGGKNGEGDDNEEGGDDDQGGDNPSDEDCVATSTQRIETPQKPRLRMIRTKKERGKPKIRRQTMEPTECTEIIDLSPKTSIKIETYTIPYTQNIVKYKTVTRKIVYIQRRRKIKRTLNKPILVIKRRVVKDRQFFERVIPKIVETREIINKPKVDYKVIEGPMEEVGGDKPVQKEQSPFGGDEDCDDGAGQNPFGNQDPYGPGNGRNGNYGPQEEDCDDPSGQGSAPQMAPPPSDPYCPPGQHNPSAHGIHVGFDFSSALKVGLNAAFGPQQDGVVQPMMRSAMFTTPCPPGMVDNGLGQAASPYGQQGGGQPGGSNIYASPHLNEYGQPTLNFQRRK